MSATGLDAPTGVAAPSGSRDSCLELYRKFAGGVSVVTTADDAGKPMGATASTVTTLSLRPAMLLVCLAAGSSTLAAIRGRRVFAVHLLRADQSAAAAAFAGRTGLFGPARFTGVTHRAVLGVPVLADALGWALCSVRDDRAYGDHSVLVGDVIAVGNGAGEPLVWHDRTFRELR